MIRRRGGLLWGPPVLYMLLIFGASSRADLPVPAGISDKSLHFWAYLLLGILFLRAFQGRIFRTVRFRPALLAVLCTLGYGLLDEAHQYFVPGRFAEWGDVLADLLGALAAVIVAYFGSWWTVARRGR